VAGFIGLYSLHVAAKPRDRDHPYGHGKAEFISAAIEGTLVLSAGAVIIIHARKKHHCAAALSRIDTGILLIGATAVINWVMGFLAYRQGKKTDSLALVPAAATCKPMRTLPLALLPAWC
jgi:divalent metal cation (Fe/Co/Zn/Cd) transporter